MSQQRTRLENDEDVSSQRGMIAPGSGRDDFAKVRGIEYDSRGVPLSKVKYVFEVKGMWKT